MFQICAVVESRFLRDLRAVHTAMHEDAYMRTPKSSTQAFQTTFPVLHQLSEADFNQSKLVVTILTYLCCPSKVYVTLPEAKVTQTLEGPRAALTSVTTSLDGSKVVSR